MEGAERPRLKINWKAKAHPYTTVRDYCVLRTLPAKRAMAQLESQHLWRSRAVPARTPVYSWRSGARCEHSVRQGPHPQLLEWLAELHMHAARQWLSFYASSRCTII